MVSDQARSFVQTLSEDHQSMLLTYGHTIAAVADDLPFFYTIGRSLFDLPELFLIGPFPISEGFQVVNELAALEDQGYFSVANALGRGPVQLRSFANVWRFETIEPERCEMFQAIYFAKNFTSLPINAVQAVWPAADGSWPDDEWALTSELDQPFGYVPLQSESLGEDRE